MPGRLLLMAPGMSFHVINPWLDVTELCFLWDGFFNGTADSSHHYELRLSNGARDAHLFSEANIARAWVSTNLFPEPECSLSYCFFIGTIHGHQHDRHSGDPEPKPSLSDIALQWTRGWSMR
ncbi:hypothetical protein L210DRAFT_2198626 [Boletus edulis BED1]|uniref:Uncharacterized protein n=1 Tax=Boletus edulis BED1 TaxID=1328754 RepID=A0AAD4BVB7_BOLED|nr:hypothetical protein L210DRAFT_2198626 [Boletus edulis BED1]